MPSKSAQTARPNDAIRFVLDGEVVSLKNIDPNRTVLNYLREDLSRVGTKEGCAEGDCGACTVVLAELNDSGNRLRFRAVNSCIQFLPTLDGKELITVESLQSPDGELHPVQRAMVDCHGSQCGFCTPGFVMSLFALYKTKDRPGRREIDDALAGNLCRCTGYRPIVDAARRMYEYGGEIEKEHQHWMNCSFSSVGDPEPPPGERETIELLRSLQRRETLALQGAGKRFFAPVHLAELAALVKKYPDATVLAGGTDVGLWVTKQHRDLNTVIYVGNVKELKRLDVTDTHIEIGASATLSDAIPTLIKYFPELEELFLRFASPPIRNAGTLGGNIANGSPIGDSMPALLALGTTLVLRKGKKTRELPMDEFYLAYQKTAREPDEVLERIRIPLAKGDAELRSYKISKRFDQDISAVCGAFYLNRQGERVARIRIAYGGIAAIPKRATHCEQALAGKDWNEATVNAASAALKKDFSPITDMRASQNYRALVARNLLYKFYLETSGFEGETRVYDYGR